jgi:hypothetical protein
MLNQLRPDSLRQVRLLCFAIAFALASALALHAAPVLMISIDGLKPEYVTHASDHGLHIPTLRRFLIEGSYADGVVPVLPSVTYPDHTTLVTGVWPAEHGIANGGWTAGGKPARSKAAEAQPRTIAVTAPRFLEARMPSCH